MIQKLKRSRAGFTLVELIVVIAILAILAGVAIPVYNNYIKKANEAGDLQLLGALNTAYAAACLEMGLDPRQIVGTVSLSGEAGNKTVTAVSASGAGMAALAAGGVSPSAALNESFLRYFGDNVDKPFKVYTSLGYDMANGVFVDGAKEITVPYGSGTITVTAAQVTAFLSSGFASLDNNPDADAITELMGEVDNVTVGAAQVLSTSARTTMLNDAGFSSFLTELGYTAEEIEAMKGSTSNTELGNKLANAMVLYTASKTKDLSANEIIEAFNAGSGFSTIANLNNGIADFATYSTIPYAMMLAYVNSEYAGNVQTGYTEKKYFGSVEEANAEGYSTTYTDRQGRIYANVPITISAYELFYNGGTVKNNKGKEIQIKGSESISSLSDVTNLQNFITNSEDFQTYMQSEQAQTDLSGFLTAMTMIDNNIDNLGESDVSNILTNGFSDTELIAMLNTALGNP